jgi:Protein of unknown function (DUF2868)
MSLSEEQLAKIILIRSVEERDPKLLSKEVLAQAFGASGSSQIGLAWLEQRAAYLFERLPTRYQSLIQLTRVPDQWTVPLCVAAFALGATTNLLGPTGEIHVVRNPVFLLLLWNLCVYLALLAALLLPRINLIRIRSAAQSSGGPASGALDHAASGNSGASWALRLLLPRLWHFFQRMTFGFGESKVYGAVIKQAALHLGALTIAAGAIVGMYGRGLLQDYRVSWASTFITSEDMVDRLLHIVFGPSLFLSRFLGLGIESQVSVPRLLGPDGDDARGWIHLFALTVILTIVIPRAWLALWQRRRVVAARRGLSLILDSYYGPLIEAPIRALIDEQIEVGAARFADDVAGFVGIALYENQIVPRLTAFREQGGKIADLKADLQSLGEAFLPALRAHIIERAVPAFHQELASRVGDLIKAIGADFNTGAAEIALDGIRLETTKDAKTGIADPLSATMGVAVATSISLTFATVGGGLGSELGIAIISALLGTTGPVGFLIGLLAGAVAAAAALWFGKESIREAVTNLKLPAAIVKTALWPSRFRKLIEDGRQECEEVVRVEVFHRLKALQPEIGARIMSKARSLWT